MSNYARYRSTRPLDFTYQLAWEAKYQKLLIQFLWAHDEFDGSAVAAWMREQGMHDPSHHNMWGAQIIYYAKQGWFTKIGSTIPTGAGHTQNVALWKSTHFKGRK